MILEQFYLGCLSQASYLVADQASGRAVVVDPRRDVEEYLRFAADRDLRIEMVILTHVHADFVPGYSELQAETGAEVAMGADAPVEFPLRRLADGERIELGAGPDGVVIEVLATPGHTPESVTLAVYEHGGDPAPRAVLTGDTLFIGDVGRPDLLGSVGRTAEEMASLLYRSLREKLLVLPDEVLVYPGHGAGSACGKALSTETVSTMGNQRMTNYALADMSEAEFVEAVTTGLAEPPAYFSAEVALNRAGHAPMPRDQELPVLSPAEAVARAEGGALLLDVRDDRSFAEAHLRHAVDVGLSGRFAEFAASVRNPGQDVVLFGSPAEVEEARMRLARVGIDTVVGAVSALPTGSDSELVETTTRLSPAAAAARLAEGGMQVLDVRNPGELAEGSLPDAVHIPLARLRGRLGELERGRPVLVYCAGGYRSIAAAGLLRAEGFAEVADLLGGYGAWRDEMAAAR